MQSSTEVPSNSAAVFSDSNEVQALPPVDVTPTVERKFLVGDLPKVLGLNDGKQLGGPHPPVS